MDPWVELVGALMSVCYTGSYLPQIQQVLRTRQARDLNPGCYIFCSLGSLFGILYCLLSKAPAWLTASMVVSALCSLWLLWACWRYRS